MYHSITMSADFRSFVQAFRAGKKPEFPTKAKSIEYARQLDSQDKLNHLRNEFTIPTRGSLRKNGLDGIIPSNMVLVTFQHSCC